MELSTQIHMYVFWFFLVTPVICFFVRDVGDTGVCIHLFGNVSAADKLQQAACTLGSGG